MAFQDEIVSCSHVIVLVCLDALTSVVNVNVMLFELLENVYIDRSWVDSYLGARNF